MPRKSFLPGEWDRSGKLDSRESKICQGDSCLGNGTDLGRPEWTCLESGPGCEVTMSQ